jgi:hypothetical protein
MKIKIATLFIISFLITFKIPFADDWIKVGEMKNIQPSKPFVVDLSTMKGTGKIESVVIVKDNAFFPAYFKVDNNKIIVTPVEAFQEESGYQLRLLFNDGKKCYIDLHITKFDEERVKDGVLLKVHPGIGKGYNYPYYLFIPDNVDKKVINRLLVEPNNSGVVTSCYDYQDSRARSIAISYYRYRSAAAELKIPFLVPIFPRSDPKIYTHNLSREAILTKEKDISRLDLQLIAMMDEAKRILDEKGIKTYNRVFLQGFSAAGSFVNRFSLLHPDKVRAVSFGGFGAIPMFPIEEWEGIKLNYPLGVADLKEILNIDFYMNKYVKIPQFVHMGEKDTNEPATYSDCFSKEDEEKIYKILGKKVFPDRWNKCKEISERLKLPARYVSYKNVGHNVGSWEDIVEFFKSNYKPLDSE